jgi:hypothetical protein
MQPDNISSIHHLRIYVSFIKQYKTVERDCKQLINSSSRRRLPDTPQFISAKENTPFNSHEKSIAKQLRNIKNSQCY